MKILGMSVGELFPLLVLIFICAVCGCIARSIGEKKGYGSTLSFCAGFFLGVIGIVIMAVVQDKSGASEEATSADALMKYKALLDAGAITQEEFDSKKKELLAGKH